MGLEYKRFRKLFVVLNSETRLTQNVKEKITTAIKKAISARFAPGDIIKIDDVPRTLSGTKLKVPIKKLLLGSDPFTIVNREAMVSPSSFFS